VPVLFTSGYGIVNYLTMVFLPVYASEFGTVAESRVLQINTAAQAMALLLVPFGGLNLFGLTIHIIGSHCAFTTP
jgi:MHS family proline/betaine transporter-like MFS transporter